MMTVIPTSCSSVLAEWISGLSLAHIPDVVRIAAEDTVIDTVALAIAARDTDYGQAVRNAFDEGGECTVWGQLGGFSAAAAAVTNGTCSHGEDYDNTFEGCPMHSGVVIVPALFAAGEALRLSNAAIAKGLVVGIEVSNRLALVSGKGVHMAGFHPTAVLGAVGAAAGVAAAMGQSPAQIRDTLGVAGSMASGIIEYLADGSWTKRLHPGWAAQSGIRAARLGAAGFRGPGSVFEGVHGLYAAFAPSIEADFSALTEGLGETWRAAHVAFKPYACGTMIQPFIDCAIRLKARGIRHDDIVDIRCDVGEGTVHRLWEPLDLKQSPPTSYAAKFSSPYGIAAGLVYGAAGLAEFTDERVRNPEVVTLASKVSYRIDPENEYPRNYTGHLRVTLKDGHVIEERQPELRGGVRAPLTREEIRTKAEANLHFAQFEPSCAAQLTAFAASIYTVQGQFDGRLLSTLHP